jgi:hypothetical protein
MTAVRFTGQESWFGTYAEATKKNFRRLSPECMICMENMLPNDKILVLPCTHGLHTRCFAPWKRQVCPVDQTAVAAVEKIDLLGREILIPPQAQQFFIWASPEKQNQINESLKNLIRKYPSFSDPKKMEPLVHLFLDFLSLLSGDSIEPNSAAKKTIKEILDSECFGKDYHKLILAKENLIFFAGMGLQLYENNREEFHRMGEEFRELGERLKQTLMEKINTDLGLKISEREAAKVLLYGLSFLEEMSSELDFRLFTYHFKKLRGLGTYAEQKKYLQALEDDERFYIERFAKGGGPTSKAIQQVAKERNRNDWVKAIAFALLFAYFLSPIMREL